MTTAKILLILLVLPYLIQSQCAYDTQTNCEPDYYWRDFDGDIPIDAIAFNEGNSTGGALYVGQVYIPKFELLVATIDPKKRKAITSAYSSIFETDKNAQILCSPNPYTFQWIPMDSAQLHLLTDTHVVDGGSEVGETLAIGRVKMDERWYLGKIFHHLRGNRGLWVAGKGNFLKYEILTYNCKVCIDIRSLS